MGVRDALAFAAGRACLWVLRDLLHRNATTLPGRVALTIAPDATASLSRKLARGGMVVCGTNGKTTTTNVLAQAVESTGFDVLCNRAGANMESGVATALLPGKRADWGVFEVDELSTVHVVPRLKPRYLLLLNLFRDQLDRCGEIERVQKVVAEALEASPATVLVYDADDPICEAVARSARAKGAKTVAFGVEGSMGLPGEGASGAAFCQECGAPLRYVQRQYGQLGDYACPTCDFARSALDYAARGVHVGEEGVSFEVVGGDLAEPVRIGVPWGGAYMVYNLLAAFIGAHFAGVGAREFQNALDAYRPQNGRLQRFDVNGRHVTLNLAKNPTGFNQNIALLLQDPAPKAVYVVINDGYGDGRDVSWLWDVDFERLLDTGGLRVFVGGSRANDVQVRLKYAGIDAAVAANVGEVLAAMEGLPSSWRLWALPNYTALWDVKADLERTGASL